MDKNDSRTVLHNVKAELSQAQFVGDKLEDEILANNAKPSRALAEENVVLPQENADLREQLRLTTQQLSEAMTALGRAMEYIQLDVVTPERNRAKSDGIVSDKNEVEEVVQANSSSVGAKEDDPYVQPLILPVPAQGRDKDRSALTAQHAPLRRGDKAAVPTRSKRKRTRARPEVSDDKDMPASTSRMTQSVSKMSSENTTKTLAELYDEWACNMFISSPQTDFPQREVWELHQNTFPTFAPGFPLCGAEELIQHIPTVFPGAKLLAIGDSDKKYIVRGISKKVISSTVTRP